MRKAFFSICFILISSFIIAQPEVDTIINGVKFYKKRQYSATRTETPPKIDGVLDDSTWQSGQWTGDFTQAVPQEGAEPSQNTKLKVMYDYNNVYVAFECFDNKPDKIRKIFSRRDQFNGDVIGIALDSYYDKRSAYEFNITSAGQKVDLKHHGDYKWDFDWNAVWDGESHVSDSGWTAEIRVPLSQLRYINQPEQKWGMHVWRWLARKKEESQWQLISQDAASMVDQFGILSGINDIKPPRQIELSPYFSLKNIPENAVTRIPHQEYQPYTPGVGLDAKVGVSSNMILDVAINPDFGQVEADPSVLNLTAYETFYDEKRPFFLEGRNLFDFSLTESQMFYSRRIGQKPEYRPALANDESINMPDKTTILSAAKLTGKTRDGLSVGIISGVTDREMATISSEGRVYDKTVNPYTNYLVGRLKKEYNDAKTILGGMVTSTNRFLKEDHLSDAIYNDAFSGGLDFIHYMKNRTYFIESRGVISHVDGTPQSITALQNQSIHRFQRPDASYLSVDSSLTSLSGSGGILRVGKKGGKWRYSLTGSWLSPNLELNDLGYMKQADMINEEMLFSYVMNEPGNIFRQYELGLEQNFVWTFGKELIDSRMGLYFESMFNNMWEVTSSAGRHFSALDPRILRGGPALASNPFWSSEIHLNTNSSKDLFFDMGYNYQFNENNLLQYHSVSGEVRWRPINRISLSNNLEYTTRYTGQQYINQYTPGDEDLYFFGDLDQKILSLIIRAALYITPEMSLEYYGNPYMSVGDYTNFKKVREPHADEFKEKFYHYRDHQVEYLSDENRYHITDPVHGDFEIINPDFNFAQFRSNLVFRWEYKLGSVLYLVWSHAQTYDENISRMSLRNDFDQLLGIPSKDVFMLKFNYWFSI